MMQQCGEPHTLALSRRSAHGDKSVQHGVPAQCPGRGRLAAVPLGRGPSLHGLRRGRALFVRPPRSEAHGPLHPGCRASVRGAVAIGAGRPATRVRVPPESYRSIAKTMAYTTRRSPGWPDRPRAGEYCGRLARNRNEVGEVEKRKRLAIQWRLGTQPPDGRFALGWEALSAHVGRC